MNSIFSPECNRVKKCIHAHKNGFGNSGHVQDSKMKEIFSLFKIKQVIDSYVYLFVFFVCCFFPVPCRVNGTESLNLIEFMWLPNQIPPLGRFHCFSLCLAAPTQQAAPLRQLCPTGLPTISLTHTLTHRRTKAQLRTHAHMHTPTHTLKAFLKLRHQQIPSVKVMQMLKLSQVYKHPNTLMHTLVHMHTHRLSPWLNPAICSSPLSPLTAAVCPGPPQSSQKSPQRDPASY